MNKRLSFAILIALAFCSWASPCLAQTDTARLQGTVTDPKDLALVGATVTVTNLGTNRVITTQTNESGFYSIPALAPGQYRIEVKQQGFKTVEQEVTLEVSQIAAINFKLELGAVTERVTVTEGAPVVEAANSSIGVVIEGRQVTDLPLNGRNFTRLATLVPGVSGGSSSDASGANGNAETFRYGSNGGAALSVNGLREQANNFTLDGVDNNESLVNTIGIFPPVEAIQEFRVQASVAPAEFGRAGGALVNASIRSGTNELHGSAFEFLRNDELDARTFFEDPTKPKREFRRNQFGGTLGGPIRKNKLFIFGDYQGLRQFFPLERELATVPTDKMRNGDFSELLPGTVIIDPLTGTQFMGSGAQPNVIPANRINSVGQKYLKAFPEPNNGTQVLQNFAGTRTQIQSFNDFDIRTDWLIRTKDLFFGRFSYGRDFSTTSPRLGILPSGFGSGSNFNKTRGVALGETHTFSSSLINEARFGFLRVFFAFTPPFQDVPLSQNLGIPNANTSPLLGGGALIGGFNNQIEYTGDFGPFLVPQNTFQFADSLSWIRGRHSLRFGGNIIRRQVNLFRPNRGKGFFFLFGNGAQPSPTHYEVSDILAGFVDTYSIGPPFGMVGTRNWETGYFAQDDLRLTRRLTLNLGVRYDLYTWPVEVLNRQANFDINTGRLLIAGQGGNSDSLVPTDKNNFAPRIGFAYALTGDGKTVVRGGYGVFYFLDRGGIDNQLAQNPPFSGFASFRFVDGVRIALSGRAPNGTGTTGSLDSRLATGSLPLGFLTSLDLNNPADVDVFAAKTSNVNSYVQQWNLQVQRQLGNDTSLSVAYVGTSGKKLATYYNLNKPRFNVAPSAPNSRRFPLLGNVNVQDTRGNSIFHSLQTQLARRLTKGWQFMTSYTWAHAIDDSTGAFGKREPQDPTNFKLERGNSNEDLRYRFIFSSLYELPFGQGRRYGSGMPKAMDYVVGGWQVTGSFILQSGLPFDLNTSGFPSDVRPDVVGPTRVNPDNLNAYFDTSAFDNPPTAVLGGTKVFARPGDAGRNIMRGPGIRDLDFSIFKNFRVTERFLTQFRAQFYNITNTPQFAQPEGRLGDGRFGKITNTLQGTNRQIEFALRVQF